MAATLRFRLIKYRLPYGGNQVILLYRIKYCLIEFSDRIHFTRKPRDF